MMTEARPGFPGARTIDHKDLPYILEVISDYAYFDPKNRGDALGIMAPINADVFPPRTLEEARTIVSKELVERRSGVQGTIILGRDRATGAYVSYLTARDIVIHTAAGEAIPIAYITRAVEEEHRRLHIGRESVQQVVVKHGRARAAAVRTRNPAAVHSFEEAISWNIFPYDFVKGETAEKEGYDNDLRMRELMVKLHFVVKSPMGEPIIWTTGVSRRDFMGENPSLEPDRGHLPTERIREMQEGRYKMDVKRGDSQLVMAWIQ